MLAEGRHWIEHVPAHHRGPLPVVLMLHGAGGHARNALKQSALARHADERGFLAVAADGTRPRPGSPAKFLTNPQMWNDGSGRRHGAASDVDDVGFLAEVLDRIAQRHKVDASRVYAMGFSNGASMALRLAAELPDRIAAVAQDAGHAFVAPRPGSRPIPTIGVLGSVDPLVPPAGGRVLLPWGGTLQQQPYLKNMSWWAGANGCDPAPHSEAAAPGVERLRWTGSGDAEVVLYVVKGAGHVWPGGEGSMPELLVGSDPGTFDASAVMLDFLLGRSL